MASEPDYRAISVPDGDRREDYHYTVRRAELLQRVEERGTPTALNGADLADEYDVSRQTISNDLDAVADHVDDTLGERRTLFATSVFETAIEELMADGEYRKATKALKDYQSWIREYQDLKELEEKVERIADAQGVDVSL